MRSLATVRAAACVVAVAAALAGCSSSHAAPAYHYRGLQPGPSLPRPSFQLVDTSGQAFDFARQTAGRPTLLYFGYTHCPDACPTTMADIASALTRDGARIQQSVVVVFVTTDPARDTGPVLRSWLDKFDAKLPVKFIGLTGSESAVHAAEAAAGVPLSSPERTGPHDYGVQHAALTLAYARDDKAHVLYPDGTTVDTYADDLPLLLAKRQPA